ncbi:serine/threonine-protein kinase [Actinopolymorpha sp. B17G11]|uniref:serine/threonine-protein kinase n=1 Tax=Actinopolymorpha sp. B17G11 TaxID=3160861 RepID=UPI0032E3CEB2
MQPLQSGDPRQLGVYALQSRLGSGAMGTVYLGISPGGRPVAVKMARAELADDPDFRERFRREVEMARSVGGFWTAAVVDADPDAERPWLATEYVAGPSLHQAVSEHGALPESAVRRLAAGLTEALAAIHAAGLIHRDLKPSNVLLGGDGPRVIDFGISQALECAKLTATGTFLGTPGFLSPEQIAGDAVGPASDVFALGAVLVYAATGHGPFGDGQTSALMYRAMHAEPQIDGVPDALRQRIAACLRRDPALRPSPAALLSELGGAEIPPATAPGWLPPPVQTLVEKYATQLRDHAGPAGAIPSSALVVASEVPGTGAGPTGAGPTGAGPTRTRPYTQLFQPGNAVQPQPPAAAPAYNGAATGGVRFGSSRGTALAWGGASAFLSLIAADIARDSSDAQKPVVALVAFIAFVMLLVTAARLLYIAARPQLSLEVSTEGLTVAKGRDRWQLPWYAVARTRVVQQGSRPWLAVWLAPGWMPPRALGGSAIRTYHGGIRLFPVAHERRRRRREREVRELRAALAWHGPQAFDRSP